MGSMTDGEIGTLLRNMKNALEFGEGVLEKRGERELAAATRDLIVKFDARLARPDEVIPFPPKRNGG